MYSVSSQIQLRWKQGSTQTLSIEGQLKTEWNWDETENSWVLFFTLGDNTNCKGRRREVPGPECGFQGKAASCRDLQLLHRHSSDTTAKTPRKQPGTDVHIALLSLSRALPPRPQQPFPSCQIPRSHRGLQTHGHLQLGSFAIPIYLKVLAQMGIPSGRSEGLCFASVLRLVL